MFVGGIKVGKLHNIDIFEMQDIINSLPKTLKYSCKCILNLDSAIANNKRYDLWIFRDKE